MVAEIEQMFEIEINKELEDKLNWFTNNYEQEIGAFIIGEIKSDKIIIEDFLVPEQEVGGASVDTEAKALIKLRKEYGDTCKKIIGHWHSHNTMSTFWSADDETFMKDFSEKRDIVVFMVSAKDEKHKVRVEIKKPLHITLDDLDYTVIYDEDDVLEKEMREIIDTKLKEKSTKDYNPDNTYYGYESPYQQNDYNKSWEKRGTEEIDVGRDNNGLKGFKEFDEMSDDEINAMLGEEKY